MSTKTNRAKLKKAKNSKEYLAIQHDINYPLYWDECCCMYPRYNRGTNNCDPKLFSYQIRMYKSWKHNRKKQWKE